MAAVVPDSPIIPDSAVARRRTRPVEILIVGVIIVGFCFVGGVWSFALSPPHTARELAVAWAVTGCWALAVWRALMTGWFSDLVWRWSGLIAATTAVALIVTSSVGDPFSDYVHVWFDLLGLYLLAALVLVALVVARLVQRPLDGALAVLVLVLFFRMPTSDHLNAVNTSMRDARIRLAEDRYRADAQQIFADPTLASDPDDGLLYFPARSGSGGAVAWIWAEGIPAHAAGVVYDPQGLGPAGVGDDGEFSYWPGCERVDGPWLWCKLT